MIDLFETIVEEEKLDPTFKVVRDMPKNQSAKMIINEIYNSWDGLDSDFIIQFQSTNFNSRLWELYLVATFQCLGFTLLENKHDRPDFKLEKDGKIFFVEAVTSNPTSDKNNNEPLFNTFEVENEDSYIKKVGSALFSKLNRKKKYWNLPWVKGYPLILAIEPFHSSSAINVYDFSIIKYLYGIEIVKYFDDNNNLIIENPKVEKHILDGKEIPNYFDQDDAKNICGIIYSNSATLGKFTRIGFQKGFGKNDSFSMFYSGEGHNHNENELDLKPFMHKILPDGDGFKDEWRFGFNFFHNQNALNPLGYEVFSDITQGRLQEDGFYRKFACFHPYNGKNIRGVSYSSEEELEKIKENSILLQDDIYPC